MTEKYMERRKTEANNLPLVIAEKQPETQPSAQKELTRVYKSAGGRSVGAGRNIGGLSPAENSEACAACVAGVRPGGYAGGIE